MQLQTITDTMLEDQPHPHHARGGYNLPLLNHGLLSWVGGSGKWSRSGVGVRGHMDMREWMGQEELKGETNGKEERAMDQKKVE